jgi:hypothetical protein
MLLHWDILGGASSAASVQVLQLRFDKSMGASSVECCLFQGMMELDGD